MTDRYTMKSRRRPETRRGEGQASFATRFRIGELSPEPAVPKRLPRPCGNLDRAPIEQVVASVERFGGTPNHSKYRRVAGTKAILGYLERFDGSTWQQRWVASRFDDGDRHVRSLVDDPSVGSFYSDAAESGNALTNALRALFSMRVIRPALLAFRVHKFYQYPAIFRQIQNDPKLDAYFEAIDCSRYGRIHRYNAKFDVCCALTTQGICLDELTPEALLYYSVQCRTHGLVLHTRQDSTRFAGLLAWDVLYEMGHFPPNTPPTLRGHIYRGQLSTVEMVDRYPIKSQSI